jgi:hypothetical protein
MTGNESEIGNTLMVFQRVRKVSLHAPHTLEDEITELFDDFML